MTKTRTYRGCNIERLFPSGYWNAMVTLRDSQGAYIVQVKADTLAGMRYIIRETLKKG